MWLYYQDDGELFQNNQYIARGYSGYGECKNNRAKQAEHNLGPIPVGLYSIGLPIDGTHMGPLAIPLTPDNHNEMHGRSAFYVHGDNAKHDASQGCIIMDRATRDKIVASKDKTLVVV